MRTVRPLTVVLAILVLVAGGLVALAQQPAEYEGRHIAHVMGWQGYTWLERGTREAEEDTPQLMRQLKVKRGQTVLDLGCGSGFHARRLARAVGPKGLVYCVDLQPEMLAIAKDLATEAGITNMQFVPGAPDRVPAPDGSVDLLLMVDVYHELAEPGPMLADLRRVLKPDGRVALVEFRLEGQTARHIKVDHRMSDAQVKKEWLPAGFSLLRRHDGLPIQHLFLFGRDG